MAVTATTTKPDVDEIIKLYDALLSKTKESLDQLLTDKKINGPTYAEMLSVAINQGIQASTQSVIALQNKETDADRCVKMKQCEVYDKDIEVKDKDIEAKQEQIDASKTRTARDDANAEKQRELTTRQIDGFDDNLRQKLFEAQMNAWAMMFSSGLLETMPCFIAGDEATELYKGIITKTMPGVADIGTEAYKQRCCEAQGGTWHSASQICTLPS